MIQRLYDTARWIRRRLIALAVLPFHLRLWFVIGSLPITIAGWIWGDLTLQVGIAVLWVVAALSILHEWATHPGYEEWIMHILHEYGTKIDSEHKFTRLQVVYTVSSSWLFGGDRWFRRFTICPTGVAAIAFLHLMYVGSTTGASWNFRRVAVEAECKDGKRGEVYVVPTWDTRQPPRLGLQLLFEQPIQLKEEREVVVSGLHPGVWNPLRNKGHDTGRFHLDEPTDQLELSIVFPRKWRSWGVLRLTPTAAPGNILSQQPDCVSPRHNRSGETEITWVVKDAIPGDYEYEVMARRRK